MRKMNYFRSILLLILPIIVYFLVDAASTSSVRNILWSLCGTIFFIDFPIGMCFLHYYFPQVFRHRNSGHYSIVPWIIFTLVCWAIVVLTMFLETQFGNYPENGFTVFCAYFFGWTYIYFTMVPIGLIYLLFRLIQKFCKKHSVRKRK